MLLGTALILLGFALVALSIVLSAREAGGRAGAGGIILVGPFPIVFGTGESMVFWAVVVGVVLLAVVYIIFFSGAVKWG